MAFPLPEKPSLAVLPFDNLSGDSSQDYFSDGITETIITNLSNVSNLFVIARNSTFTYKGKPVKVQQVAEELGVRYVLEGSVQKSEDRVRITAQLIDALTGHHLWAENYDRELGDIFALQDDITEHITMALQVKLTEGEQARIRRGNTDNPEAYEYFLRGLETYRSFTKENNAEARKLWEKTAELDPNYSHIWQSIGWTYYRDGRFGWTDTPEQSLAHAEKLAQKTLAMDDSDAFAYGLLSVIYMAKGQHEKAVAYAEETLALATNAGDNTATMALPFLYSGKPKMAIELVKNAMRQSPYYPSWYLSILGLAYRLTGQYDEAIAWLEKWRDRANPRSTFPPLFLAYTYEEAGRGEEAQNAVAELLKRKPKASIKGYEKSKVFPYKDPAEVKRILESLRKAGLPESPPLPLPDKPSIAVLPFDNMSDDPKQEYFADGMSDDLITDLSKISGLLVIARNSTFSYKGTAVKIPQIAQELGVRYVLEGSVRRAGDKVRINAQLIDSTTGGHLWAERYDGRMDDIFALQDKINRKIISALALKLTASEQKALTDKGTDNLQAYDEFLKGWQSYRLLTKTGFAEAKIHLEKAVELDPEFARAYAALAVLYWKAIKYAAPELWQGLGLTTRAAKAAAQLKPQFLVKKAMQKPTALAHGLMSQFYLMRFQRDEALAEIERAVAMDPNNPELYAWMSNILWFMGKNSEAIESAKMGLRLDPNNPTMYLIQLGKASLPDGNLQEGLQVLERAIRINPEFSGVAAFTQSIIYGIQGRNEEARTAYKILLKNRMYPVRNLNDVMCYLPFADPKTLDRIAEAFIKAGVPGKPTDYYRILKENRLNGQEVKSLLIGRKITGTSVVTGKQLWWEWAKSGEFKYITGPYQDMGKSWVEGDVFFIKFEKFLGGLPYGTTIYRNPDGSRESKNQYFMVSVTGAITAFSPTE
jgi:TolB-like protein/predicted Zn-dependent protease